MKRYLCSILLIITCIKLAAQNNDPQLSKMILEKDSLFWQAYNTCDIKSVRTFFTDNVEFYHDKGGITLGLDNLIKSFTDGLCKQPEEFRLRREAIPGTVNVFPLHRSDTIYGAIISGEHYFYINEKGKPERRDGWAKFTHLWLKENGVWKMTRVLSYDHKPASSNRKTAHVSQELLNKYVGKYKGRALCEIQAAQGVLTLTAKEKSVTLYPESETIFFMKERDLTFEFNGNKMIVRENGGVAEELVKE